MKRHQFVRVTILGVWVLALSTLWQADAQTPPAVRFTSGNSALKIPLEIDNNLILLRVSVNGSKPLKFIFDTGASHSVIDSKRALELGLKTQGELTGTATGGPVRGSYTTGVSLSVLGAEVSNQFIGSFPFPVVPGFEFDGVIGYDFINQFVIEIDYPNKLMNLYDPRAYAYGGKEEAIPLLFDGGRTPSVLTKIVLDGRAPFEAKLEVDTGADGTFVLDGPFVKKQGLQAYMPNAVKDRGRGAGGEQPRLLGQVKAVHFGRFIMKDPPLAFVLDTKGPRAPEEQDGLMGGEIFRRFTVILDYRHQRMILEPNKSFNDPYQLEVGG
jgi:Aspartyl protease